MRLIKSVARSVQDILRLMKEWDAIWKENLLPIYTWKCSICEQSFDVIRPMSEHQITPDDTESKPCMEGATHEFTKVIGGANFQLAGRGWFRDGYQK